MTTSRPAFVRLAVAIAMATLSACGQPTDPPPDDGTRCANGSSYGCGKPDMLPPADLVTPPDLDPPAGDMTTIANGMDCSGLKPSYTCNASGGVSICVPTKMDQGACLIVCDGGSTTVWRITAPADPQTAPDRRFWTDTMGHIKVAGEIDSCMSP